MSMSPKDDELLTRYLLGAQLGEQEERSIEDLFFKADEYLDQMDVLENELIESYLKKALSEEDQILFRNQLSISSRLRRRVEWTERHVRASAGQSHPATAFPGAPQTATSWWGTLQVAWQRHRHTARPALVTVGLLALVAVGIWSAKEEHLTRELKHTLVEQRSLYEQLSIQLRNEQAQRESLDRDLATLRDSPRLFVASLLLTPADAIQTGQRRGGGGATLTVAPRAGILQLQMILKADKHREYRGVIETVEGREVLRQSGLTSQQVKGTRLVLWQVSADALVPNDYVLTLSGVSSNGKISPVGFYSFRLERASASHPF